MSYIPSPPHQCNSCNNRYPIPVALPTNHIQPESKFLRIPIPKIASTPKRSNVPQPSPMTYSPLTKNLKLYSIQYYKKK